MPVCGDSYFLSQKTNSPPHRPHHPAPGSGKIERLTKGKTLDLTQRFLVILGKMIWSLSYQQLALESVKFGLQTYLAKLSKKSKGGFISKNEIYHQIVSIL